MKNILLVSVLSVGLFAQSSADIARKSYEAISGYGSSVSKTTMILKNAQGVENTRKLEIKKLETDDGDRSLISFLYPLDIKNTKLLSFEQIGGDDRQWLYLPALKRVKRISASNRSGSFMASEFSYEDIASQNYKNYTYEGEAQKINKDGLEYFQITRVPKDKNSGYSRQVVYIDTKSYLARFGEYYDKQNRLLKEVTFSEYRKLDNLYRIQKINMHNVQSGKSSLLIWDQDEIKAGLKPYDFSKRALK
ncbi:outer membrane lipoprotein-sorting protein [Sulfurimonas sp. HSL3-7]|uniref:outer membrane lipoprotein-sorting protein n=1 Tax=Sulfonitrofixus jiaomeiensis TaxID=3131938 RepID=UPI0031F9EAC7